MYKITWSFKCERNLIHAASVDVYHATIDGARKEARRLISICGEGRVDVCRVEERIHSSLTPVTWTETFDSLSPLPAKEP